MVDQGDKPFLHPNVHVRYLPEPWVTETSRGALDRAGAATGTHEKSFGSLAQMVRSPSPSVSSPSVSGDASIDLPDAAGPSGPRRARYAAPVPRTALIVFGGLATLVAVVAIATFVERRIYAGRVLPGVEVDGVSSSGRHEQYVYDKVTSLGVQLAAAPVRVRIGDKELTADPSLLDLHVDGRATAHASFEQGRGGSLLSQLVGTASRWVRPDHVRLRAVYDDDRLEGMLDGWSAETGNPAVEGGLRFEGARVIPIEPKSGTGILRAQARAALVRMLASPDRPVVTLPVGTIRPQLDAAAVGAAATHARTAAARRRHPPDRQGIGAGDAEPAGERDGQRRWSATRSRSPSIPAGCTPRFGLAGAARATAGRRDVRRDRAEHGERRAVAGRAPDRHGRGGRARSSAANDASTRRCATPHRARHQVGAVAGHRRARCRRSRPSTRAGETRVDNIHRGADLLNNTVVEPGHDLLAQRHDRAAHTRSAASSPRRCSREGEFFDDYGGGVSQLATTTYNAGVLRRLPDVTHQPHTIYISRYPAGREATVNYGAIDLQFRERHAATASSSAPTTATRR